MLLYICGPGGSGKDTLVDGIVNRTHDFQRVVEYCTRPKRDYEIDGEEYIFLSNDDFKQLESEGKILESIAVHLDGDRPWYYGTPISLKTDNDKYIMSGPISKLDNLRKAGVQVKSVFLKTTPYICLERMLDRCGREDQPSVVEACRRVFNDANDFKGIDLRQFDLCLDNGRMPIDIEVQHVLGIL